MNRRSVLFSLTAIGIAPYALCQRPVVNFSGVWKQNNDRCEPKRTGEVLRHIDQHGSKLTIETTISRAGGPPRHALQRYMTDGKLSVSTGTDGDEFHTSVVWKDTSLVFSIEEHEDGRIILSREIWSLIENESVLKVDREIVGAQSARAVKQQIIYTRQASATGSR